MIYITQLIYLKEGAEDVFEQFENIAMPIIPRYNGKLLLRIRPEDSSFIEANIERIRAFLKKELLPETEGGELPIFGHF